jgi:hypothetical protein
VKRFLYICLLAACSTAEVPPGADASTPGAAASMGDSLPLGAISFFKSEHCPPGWVKFDAGVGRLLVPTVAATLPGTMHGTPLANGEDRTHTHDIAASITLGGVSYAGVVGGGNGGVAPAGTYGFAAATSPASSGLPYVQLLVCFKSAPPVAAAAPVPTGTLLFFRSQCPTGWTQAASTQGRFLVGVPAGAPPNVSFGGAPLASDETRRHVHKAAGTVEVGHHGIALASGCCGGGYAEGGSFPYMLTSSDSGLDLPYLELLHCRKE